MNISCTYGWSNCNQFMTSVQVYECISLLEYVNRFRPCVVHNIVCLPLRLFVVIFSFVVLIAHKVEWRLGGKFLWMKDLTFVCI